METNFQQWLNHRSARQTQLADLGAGLAEASLDGLTNFCALNFDVARRQLELVGKCWATMATCQARKTPSPGRDRTKAEA